MLRRRANSPGAAAGRALRRAGFTITELMVVVLILGVLTGMILTAVTAARRAVARDNTKMMISALSAAIERYQMDWGDFPPGDGGITGSESLQAALNSRRFEGPYVKGEYPPTRDDNRNARREFVDHWGRPLSYTHHRHYQGAPKADEYRLTSDGPDGRPNTDDDIVNWKK
jgi:general secretion pathway protein G